MFIHIYIFTHLYFYVTKALVEVLKYFNIVRMEVILVGYHQKGRCFNYFHYCYIMITIKYYIIWISLLINNIDVSYYHYHYFILKVLKSLMLKLQNWLTKFQKVMSWKSAFLQRETIFQLGKDLVIHRLSLRIIKASK